MSGGPLSHRPLPTALSIWSEASASLCDHLDVPAGERPRRPYRAVLEFDSKYFGLREKLRAGL